MDADCGHSAAEHSRMGSPGQQRRIIISISTVSVSSIAENDVSREKMQKCGNLKFQCQNGSCIERFQICDGVADCSDKSDENEETCKSIRCPDGSFRCGYGACVAKNATCDGTIQCEGDGSDEAPDLCGYYVESQSNKSENLQEECGITVPKNQTFVLDGKPVMTVEFPWYVIIYRYSKESGKFKDACDGSIIKRKLVLTNAHCLERSLNPKDYMIGAGKYHSSWDVKDPAEQRLEVESIEFIPGYSGVTLLYLNDIAIIVLKNEITISDFVRPVCLDVEKKYMREQLSAGSLGSMVHRGCAESRGPSDALVTTKLPFIESKKCYDLLPSYMRSYVSFEKFCAGYVNGSDTNGPAVCRGTGGAGLSFEQEITAKRKQWFLQGVASISFSTEGEIGTRLPILFTNVNEHMEWIKTYYDKY